MHATFSQYFLDNGKLPVVSNVEYHLLPGEHYVISTEMILLRYLQNFSLVGLYNKKLHLSSTILVSTDIVIVNSYNVTITNVIFKVSLPFTAGDIDVKVQLVVCVYCTIENVTLGCGLLGHNLIGRSYLNNIFILSTEYLCNSYQGIMLHYVNYSFNEFQAKSEIAYGKCITTLQNIRLVYHDSNTICDTDRGIIFVDIEEYQTVDSIEIIISNSQFNDVSLQPIIDIKDASITNGCKIWIINCTFESISVSIIIANVSHFNTTLMFFNCGFRYCHSGSEEYLVTVVIIVTSEMKFRNVACTNITFSKCNFSNNVVDFILLEMRGYHTVNYTYILLIGPSYISDNEIISDSSNLIYIAIESVAIDKMDIHIYGPINISNNAVYNIDIMAFQSCKVLLKGPITISSNLATERNIILLEYCNVSFHGPITMSQHYGTDSIILFIACDITFDKQIMFISNICHNIITIKLQYTYTYIKIMQNTNLTFLTNQCFDDIIAFDLNNDHNKPYPYCLFQYMTTKTT